METRDIPIVIISMLAGIGIEKLLQIAGIIGSIGAAY